MDSKGDANAAVVFDSDEVIPQELREATAIGGTSIPFLYISLATIEVNCSLEQQNLDQKGMTDHFNQ